MSIDLASLKSQDIPVYSFSGYSTLMKCVEVYDGDTFVGIMISPQGVPIKLHCRLLGIDTPEMRPPLKTPDRANVVARAKRARDRLCELLTAQTGAWSYPCDGHGNLVQIECGKFDKFGRLLVRVGEVANTLLREGLASPYNDDARASKEPL